jgi:thiol-disulfide isomerase/thioredoxin
MQNVFRSCVSSLPIRRLFFRLFALALCSQAFPLYGTEPTEEKSAAEQVSWLHDYSKGVYESAASKRPMVIVVGAKWCGSCHRFYGQTLPNPDIIALLNEQFVPVMLDADKEPELTQKLKVESMPTVIIVSPERKILRRIAGFQSATELNAQLKPYKRPVEPAMAAN